jgi:putative glutathione S-transferase
MYGCPWAHRTLIVRALKGLEHAIGVTALSHRMTERGWAFSPDHPEPFYRAKLLRELYRKADPAFAGRVTVPVLWDTVEQTIVNNESSEIIRMLNGAFDAYARHPEVDLYPPALRPAIDRWNDRIQAGVNAGAYEAGFATTQEAYDDAVRAFFATLDELDAHLQRHRYLVGDRPTEADWRLFPTLIRFEWVYHHLFRCDAKRLVDYPALFAYARELFQWPGIAATIDERQTRDGYYTGMPHLNPSRIVPIGPRVDFTAPHGRG